MCLGGRFIILALFVCLSASAAKKARTGCDVSAARLPESPTERFVALVEKLVAKGSLTADAVEEIASSETPVNPADLTTGLAAIPRHVYREAFVAIPSVDWPSVRTLLHDGVLPPLRGSSANREEASLATNRIPAPYVIKRLDDVVSALKNATGEDHGISFVLDGKSWAVVRTKRGLLLVDISTGETKVLSRKPYYQGEKPVFFIHDGVPHLVTAEQIAQNRYVSDYDPRTGTVRRKLPKPGAFPVGYHGLAAAVLDGKPYAVEGYMFSRYMDQPERDLARGIWFTPLSPGGEGIRFETGERILDQPVVGTVGGRTLIGVKDYSGRNFYFLDPRDGHDVSKFSADILGHFQTRAHISMHLYESRGQPRAAVATETGLLIVDPVAGKKIATVDVDQIEHSKGITSVEVGGKPYLLTNGYRDVVLIDVDKNKVETVISFGADSNDSVTARPQVYKHEGLSYAVWGSYDGNVFTAVLPSGAIISKQKLASHKIMDLHLSGLPGETKALIVPYGEPARLIDLLSAE